MICIWDIFKLTQPRQVPDFETHYQNNSNYNPNDNNFSLISCSEAAMLASAEFPILAWKCAAMSDKVRIICKLFIHVKLME